MNILRKSALCTALTALLATSTAYAQDLRLRVVPFPEDAVPLQVYRSAQTGPYIVNWQVIQGTGLVVECYDVESGALAGRSTMDWDNDLMALEGFLPWNDQYFMIKAVLNKATERVNVYAQAYSLPDWTPQGEAIPLVSDLEAELLSQWISASYPTEGLDTDQHESRRAIRSGIALYRSADDEQLLITHFSRSKTLSRAYHMEGWVYDAELTPVQHFAMDLMHCGHGMDPFLRSVLVHTDGTVHMLVCTKENGDKEAGHAYKHIIRISDGQAHVVALKPSGDADLLGVDMAYAGDRIHLVGFYGTGKAEETKGTCSAFIPLDVDEPISIELQPFEKPRVQYNAASLMRGPGGEHYLIGDNQQRETFQSDSEETIVIAFDKGHNTQWRTVIPRAPIQNMSSGRGFRVVATEGGPVLFLSDIEENLALRKAGKKLKRTTYVLQTLMVRFDEAGAPSFSMLGAPDHMVDRADLASSQDGRFLYARVRPAFTSAVQYMRSEYSLGILDLFPSSR
jgi:hypothetical protein